LVEGLPDLGESVALSLPAVEIGCLAGRQTRRAYPNEAQIGSPCTCAT